MADLLIDNEAAPAAPAAGKSMVLVDQTTKRLVTVDDAGGIRGLLSRNFSIASQGAGFAADTYVTNSGLLIPSIGLQAGFLFRWLINASKTAAGVAAPIYTLRLGPNQSVADTALMTLTPAVQTAVADNGTLLLTALLRNVGAAGVLAACAAWAKTQAGTAGLGGSIDGVSAGFDTTGRAGLYLGLSINAGTAAAWTLTAVAGDLNN